jgi:hypothetical protein
VLGVRACGTYYGRCDSSIFTGAVPANDNRDSVKPKRWVHVTCKKTKGRRFVKWALVAALRFDHPALLIRGENKL